MLLDPNFDGANVTIKAKTPDGGSGDGLINLGAITPRAVPLGKLEIEGDLGQIDAGSASSSTG
jgi:hypothetical protein